MFQAPKKSLKRDIALLAAIAAAGFKLTDSKSIETHDGPAWHATLTQGRVKLVTVSNGGDGGDDESLFHAATPAERATATASLKLLFAIPAVADTVRSHLHFNLDLKKQFPEDEVIDFAAAEAAIEANVPEPTEDNIEFLVGRIADVTESIKPLKRTIKTKLLIVFEGGDEKWSYVEYRCADTPANRQLVKDHEKARKIDYFVADLVLATNETKGA